MKRNSLTTAVIAGIAGVAGIANMAGAVNLNPDGLGQVLIYPYYTVRGGNGTLLSVVNTHDEGKAVKVRFLEGYNSREVLDFNLYLSPFDVWVAQTYDNGAGGSVATFDNSCTVPAFPNKLASGAKSVDFNNFGYTQGPAYTLGSFQGNDTGPTGLDRTREGYVEMIEMGVVTNQTTHNSLIAISHNNGVPANCNKVIGAWAGGYWVSNSNIDITAPSGGLFGAGSIINVAEGTIAAYDADAIDGFRCTVGAGCADHTNPGLIVPNLSNANFVGAGQPGPVTSYVFNNGALIISNYNIPNAIDAVSSVFAANDVYNEYVTDPTVGAASEWVVTFPTKRFYVDPAIVGVWVDSYIQPFEETFGGGRRFTSNNGVRTATTGPVDPGESCFSVSLAYTDREEAQQTTGVNFSPAPIASGNYLCYEAQTITFNQNNVEPGVPTAILGSVLAENIPTSYNSGWLDLSFPDSFESLRASIEGNVFHGLPVTGFLVTNYVNANVNPGVLANYSGLYRHRIDRDEFNTSAL